MSTSFANPSNLPRSRRFGEQGQGVVEYALIMVLVAIVCIVILAVLGPSLSGVYCTVISELGGDCTSGRYFNTWDDFTDACFAEDGGYVGNYTNIADNPEGYFGTQCMADSGTPFDASDDGLLWIGYVPN